ncbi:MAG TPA: hypothetical protein V6C84_19235 [Coleofasciculaceae cyanobacterium]|jgi:hypothetical protein
MWINFAHLRERSTSGSWINFAVFEAKFTSGTNSDNNTLLSQSTNKARASGLRIDQYALVFVQHGRIQFYGDQNLVNYLSRSGVPQWIHTINV